MKILQRAIKWLENLFNPVVKCKKVGTGKKVEIKW